MTLLRRRLVLALFPLMLASCASDSKFTCGTPVSEGACRSLADVYHNRPGTPDDKERGTKSTATEPVTVARVQTRLQAPVVGSAIITRPSVIRILINPWRDADGDLDGGGDLFLRLDDGEWTIGQ